MTAHTLDNFEELHASVAAADPLDASATMPELCALNRDADVPGIASRLRALLPNAKAASDYSFTNAAAAMRDLGFFLGSLKRHGHEPVGIVPEVEPILLALAQITSMPPRETLLHLTVWNPLGTAERSYTGLMHERHLLQSVRISMTSLESALSGISLLAECSVRSSEFAELCESITEQLAKMVESVVYAYRYIPPRLFMLDLRPFYDPIVVAGRSYLGPGAVEMPMFVFEHVLWGSNVSQPEYIEFKETYLPYILPPYRTLYARHETRPSIVDQVVSELRGATSFSPTVVRSLSQIDRMFDCLVRFRAPHLRLAEKAYAVDLERRPEVGSGGYAMDMLTMLLKLTREARAKIAGVANAKMHNRQAESI